jgi:DNA-binding transcriptional LysR family regulator
LKFTLSQLEALVWVVRLGSFRAAASRLNITQPAISVRLRELELIVGDPLFERRSYRAQPTTRGRQIAWQAERVLEQAEALERQIAQADGLAGPIRIGVADTFAMTCGSRLLRQIEIRYPQARAELRADFSVRLDASLHKGELDIAVLTWPTPDPLVHIEPLIDMPLEWVASPERLAELAPRRRQRTIGPTDIVRWPILTNPSPSNLFVSIADWFGSAGCHPERLITCNSLGIMTRMACDGAGLSLLPTGILHDEIRSGRLVVLPSRPKIPPHQASVAYRRDAPGSGLAQLSSLITEIAHDSALAQRLPRLEERHAS